MRHEASGTIRTPRSCRLLRCGTSGGRVGAPARAPEPARSGSNWVADVHHGRWGVCQSAGLPQLEQMLIRKHPGPHLAQKVIGLFHLVSQKAPCDTQCGTLVGTGSGPAGQVGVYEQRHPRPRPSTILHPPLGRAPVSRGRVHGHQPTHHADSLGERIAGQGDQHAPPWAEHLA